MTDAGIIVDGRVVGLSYRLTDDEGELIEETGDEGPLYYLHGAGNIVEGLESALTNKRLGDRVSVVVQPEQGYGTREGPGPQPIPRDTFPEEVELEPGMAFEIEDEHGNEVELFVVGIEGDQVYIDANHPLAGITLHFEVEILSVRPATAEELDHGHPHEGQTH